MIKRLEKLKNTVNKYMADIQPDRLTTCQSEQKSVVSRRPSVLWYVVSLNFQHSFSEFEAKLNANALFLQVSHYKITDHT
jgi:hypothetical protein